MDARELKGRTKRFALRAIRLVKALPRCAEADVIGKQLLRCACSVGANYRAACRGRSKAEFIAKLGIVEEEADESAFWLELIVESGLMKPNRVKALRQEAEELVAIICASRKSASLRRGQSKITNPKSKMR